MFRLFGRKKPTLPDELVAAIQGASIAFRNNDSEDGPRPLLWGFLEARPLQADEPDKIERRISRHFDLTGPELKRAVRLIQARSAEHARQEAQAARMDGKPKRNWVNSWGGEQPWQL